MAPFAGPSMVFAIGWGHTSEFLLTFLFALIFLGNLLLMSPFDVPAKMGQGDKVSALFAIKGTNFIFARGKRHEQSLGKKE